jgi:hypothetical protein
MMIPKNRDSSGTALLYIVDPVFVRASSGQLVLSRRLALGCSQRAPLP